jgi:hypothetical protein
VSAPLRSLIDTSPTIQYSILLQTYGLKELYNCTALTIREKIDFLVMQHQKWRMGILRPVAEFSGPSRVFFRPMLMSSGLLAHPHARHWEVPEGQNAK